jgi:hypothetical protein
MALLTCDRRKSLFLSDFDVFDILCENLYMMEFHELRKNFLNAVEAESGVEISVAELYSPKYRISLWQKIFDIDAECKRDIEPTQKKINNAIQNKVFDLNFCMDNHFDSIYDLLQNVLENIKNENPDAIAFDAVNIRFSRPDDYSASLNYQANKIGEGDASVISLWLLCRVLMKTNASLVLKCESAQKAEKILNLIFNLRLTPKTVIFFETSIADEYNEIFDLLLKYKEKNISLGLLPKESEDLISILETIPLCFVAEVNASQNLIFDAFDGVPEYEKPMIFSFLNMEE